MKRVDNDMIFVPRSASQLFSGEKKQFTVTNTEDSNFFSPYEPREDNLKGYN
jgi:hypothetical protein